MSTLPKYDPYLLTLPLYRQSKTWDTFHIPHHSDLLLLVLTDRFSTDGIVHDSYTSDKGRVLTAMTVFWSQMLPELADYIVAYGEEIYRYLKPGHTGDYPENLYKQALVVLRLEMIPIQFALHSGLSKNLWKTYSSHELESSHGLALPPGLPLMHRFEPPLFIPTVKADTESPLHSHKTAHRYREEVNFLRRVYAIGSEYIQSRGIELMGAELQGGYDHNKRFILANAFTPDTAYFAQPDMIEAEQEPHWLDKQFLRDEAKRIWGDGERYPIRFHKKTLQRGTDLYHESFEVIVGQPLESFQAKHGML